MQGGARLAASLLLTALGGGCTPAMTTVIENHGPPVAVHYLCGDAMYEATLGTGERRVWTPTANACHLEVGEAKGRRLSVTNECRHSHGCSVTAGLRPPGGASATLPGSGRLEIDGDGVRKE